MSPVQSPIYEMASVLFMDIVSYSLYSIDEQTELLTMLERIVRETAVYQQASAREELITLPTGDGMALVFMRDPVSPAQCALEIAASLRSHPEIKLRMGLHTGPVRRHDDIRAGPNVVGGGINIAQRVMDCGDAGHILVSQNVAEVLDQLRDWKGSLQDLGVHKVKHGVKLHLYNLCKEGLGNPELPNRIRQPLQRARDAVALFEFPNLLSRRRVLAYCGLAAASCVGAGLWYEWPRLFQPLPEKRFVALMAWPVGEDAPNRGLLHNILDAIESGLSQVERAIPGFLVISRADPQSPADLTKPADAAGLLGANLVLAASIDSTANQYKVELRVLDSSTARVLRSGVVRAAASALSSLFDKACKRAAQLLDVSVVHAASRDEDEIAGLSADLLRVYAEAEDLMERPNEKGLDAAISEYQKLLELKPRLAVGLAEIARAYVRKFSLTRDGSYLDLAAGNADLARKYNPASARARFSTVLVLLNTGKTERAIEILNELLRDDPTNPQYASWKANALLAAGRPTEVEAVYRQVIMRRPNYWPAYNDLGYALERQRRYEEAAKAFSEASDVAPLVALPLANLGSIYLALGRNSEAADALRRSIDRAPNSYAYSNLGTVYSQSGDYKKALLSFNKARDFMPGDSENWRNVADCQTNLGNPGAARNAYAKAAELAAAEVQINPKLGPVWMALAFYRAKAGDGPGFEAALRQGEAFGDLDVQSLFFKAQALAANGRRREALNLVIELLQRGLSPVEVELALDLDRIRQEPRYKAAVERKNK